MLQVLPSVLSVFWVVPLFIGSYGVGARLLKLARADGNEVSVDVTLASCLGWFVLSYVTLALGLAGVLRTGPLWAVTAIS